MFEMLRFQKRTGDCCGESPTEDPDASAGSSEGSEPPNVEYEFVWFNAWLYNGTDNVWAALILKLYDAVEKHYGSEYIYAERRALLWAVTLRCFA